MIRKKELPDYENAGRNISNALIQKSNPLLSLSKTDLTLPEFKILDAYLARINTHDPSKRTVRFEKGVLEETLGVTRILKPELRKRLRHLFQVVEVEDATHPDGINLVSLFEEAVAEPDENGQWQITLTCTTAAREYIFNLETIGYLRYRLSTILALKSRYSYVMYLYLERNRFRKSWEVSLDDLKDTMRCTAPTYNEYKRFNNLVLQRCQKELHENTKVRFSYEPVKKGRTVVAIRFTLETLPVIPAEPDQTTTPQLDGYGQIAIDERQPFWVFGPLPWLTEAQAEEVRLLVIQLDESKLPVNSARELQYYDYLQLVSARLEQAKEIAVANGKTIRNQFRYLTTIIKNDIEG